LNARENVAPSSSLTRTVVPASTAMRGVVAEAATLSGSASSWSS
jgi:hypothetical protein